MKGMKYVFGWLLLCAALVMFSPAAKAQTKGDSPWKTEEDFKKAEPQVLGAIQWVKEHPGKDDEARRKEFNLYVLAWVSGCPYVSVTLDDVYLKLISDKGGEDKHGAEYLMAFMGGKVLYILQHKDHPDEQAANLEGARYLLEAYRGFTAWDKHAKSKHMDKMAKLTEPELKELVAANTPKPKK